MRWPSAATLSLRRRVVLGTAIATTIGMLTLTVLLQVVLSLIVNHDIDGVLADRTDAISSTLVDAQGSLQALEPRSRVPDDGSWIYDATGVLVDGSPAIPEIRTQLSSLSSTTQRTTVDTGDYRILATPIEGSSGRAGVLVVAERLAPYERTEQHALVVSVLLGLVVVADVQLAVPESVAVRILSPILDNALRYHLDEVRVTGQLDTHLARILVDDDGPGLGTVTPEDAFSAGERHPDSRGAGLGLALSRRLAHAVGGEVSYVDGDGGASFLVELPLD